MTPHADPFDGKLTLAFGYRSSRLGLFAALPSAFKEGSGSYVELPACASSTAPGSGCTSASRRLSTPMGPLRRMAD